MSALVLVGLLLTYSGCKSSDPTPQSEQDKQLTKLSKTWKCSAVTLNGSAPNPAVPSVPSYTYVNTFVLTIAGTPGQTTFNYTTAGRPVDGTNKVTPWPASGTFSFGSDFATVITRDDNLPVSYVVSDTDLQLTFNYTGSGYAGSRVSQVTGQWVFSFKAQ